MVRARPLNRHNSAEVNGGSRFLKSPSRGDSYARRHFRGGDHPILCHRDSLYPRLRTPEIGRRPGMIENVLLIVICVLLFGYLLVALLKPEKF
jgi:K+-transporting ATPase KdpF subunit